MKYLKLYEIKRTIKQLGFPAPNKVLPKISIKELLYYSNAQKLINKYNKILPICVKEYVNFNKEEIIKNIGDLPDDDIYDGEFKIKNNNIIIDIEYEDDTSGRGWGVGTIYELEVPIEEFVEFCNNYDVHVSSKKYNL